MSSQSELSPPTLGWERPIDEVADARNPAAVVDGSRICAWAQLGSLSRAMWRRLEQTRPGQTIGLRFDGGFEYLLAAIAVASAGRTFGIEGSPTISELPQSDSSEETLRGVAVSPEFEIFREDFLAPRQFSQEWSLGDSDCVALPLAPGFTTLMLEAIQAVAAGASVVALPSAPVAPRKIATLLRDYAATVFHSGAETLLQLAREFPWGLRDVRRIFCDARETNEERLSQQLPAEVRSKTFLRYGDPELGGVWGVRRPEGAGWGPLEIAGQVCVRIAGSEEAGGEIHASLRSGAAGPAPTRVSARRLDGRLEIISDALTSEEFKPDLAGEISPTERELIKIWREVLDGKEFTTDDNFFDVGGKSTGLVKVAALAQQRLGKKVSLMTLFANPTIRALSATLDSNHVG
jgi:hypothetical protein